MFTEFKNEVLLLTKRPKPRIPSLLPVVLGWVRMQQHVGVRRVRLDARERVHESAERSVAAQCAQRLQHHHAPLVHHHVPPHAPPRRAWGEGELDGVIKNSNTHILYDCQMMFVKYFINS